MTTGKVFALACGAILLVVLVSALLTRLALAYV